MKKVTRATETITPFVSSGQVIKEAKAKHPASPPPLLKDAFIVVNGKQVI